MTLRSRIPQSYINHGRAVTVSSQSLTFVCTQQLVFPIIISSKHSSVVPKLGVLICSLHCSIGQLRLGHNSLLPGWSSCHILSRWRWAEWPWRWRWRWWWWLSPCCSGRRRRGLAAWRCRGLGPLSATRRRWCSNCRWCRASAATAAGASVPWCSLPGTRRPASARPTASARTAPTWGTTSTRCWRSATCWTRCRASTVPTAPPTSSSTSPPPIKRPN